MTNHDRRTFARSAALGAAAFLGNAGTVRAATTASTSYVNVRTDFGAKGDGVTDDTAAIQNAINSIYPLKSGSQPVSLFFPPGIYPCSAPLQLASNACLIGVPGWDYDSPGGSQLKLTNPSASCLLNLSPVNNVLVKGVTIDGLSLVGPGSGSAHGILRNDPEPFTTSATSTETLTLIEHCRITGFGGDGVHLSHSWVWTIRHSMIGANLGDGISVAGWDGWILDNWLSGNKGCGLRVYGPYAGYSSELTMTGNRVEWNGQQGVLITNASNSIQVNGNFFDRNWLSGLAALLGSQHLALTGNIFHQNGWSSANTATSPENSHLHLDTVAGVACTGNVFRADSQNSGTAGTQAKSPAFAIYYRNMTDSVISNNALHQGSTATPAINGDTAATSTNSIVNQNPSSLF